MAHQIRLYDPVGEEYAAAPMAHPRGVDSLQGKTVGFLFNSHRSARSFWKELQEAVGRLYAPHRAVGLEKWNTWSPAPGELIDQLASGTDYAVVGVGA